MATFEGASIISKEEGGEVVVQESTTSQAVSVDVTFYHCVSEQYWDLDSEECEPCVDIEDGDSEVSE